MDDVRSARVAHLRRHVSFAFTYLAFLFTLPATANSVEATTWEQLVVSADFVGVVECEIAGSAVARYRIVESWKGPAPGGRITINDRLDGNGAIPIRLAGERFVVAACILRVLANTEPLRHGAPGAPGLEFPVAADYGFQAHEGCAKVSQSARHRDELKEMTLRLLSQSPEAQEMTLLRMLSDKHLNGAAWNAAGETKVLAAALGQARTVREMLDTFVDFAQAVPERSGTVARVWSHGGMAETLKYIKGARDRVIPFDLRSVRTEIEHRLGLRSIPLDSGPEVSEAVPTVSQLALYRRDLQVGPPDFAFYKAFARLSRYEPETAVAWLNQWKPGDGDKMGYYDYTGQCLGANFALMCGNDREAYLEELLRAQDPYVRVAAAEYLCFENEKDGLDALRHLAHFGGDPGAWAAFSLARRGDKDAMARALRAFDVAADRHGMAGLFRYNLQRQLLVLLSNTAKSSGVPAFEPPRLQSGELSWNQVGEFCTQWWEDHGAEATPTDPWLAEMKKR